MKTKSLHTAIIACSVILVILVVVAVLLTPRRPESPGPSEPIINTPAQPLFGWQQLEGKTYYYDPATGEKCTGWLELPEGKYFLDSNGNPTVGLFPCPQGSYYFDEDGKMVTGWADTPDGKRYFAEDGTMTVGFLELDGKRYCFDQGGVMCIGWHELQGQWFYFDKNGVMNTATGWLYLEEGTWFLKEDGQPYTGWMKTDEARYYFLEDGAMATGSREVDGVMRYFSSDGNYVPLVNPWNKVPKDYKPDLVGIEGHKMDSTCVGALNDLVKAARKEGLTCVLNSSYRDMATQTYLWNRRYNDYISKGYSEEEAYRLSARRVAYPGTSEHHTGLAIDIVEIVEDGTLYEWFRQHAWEYGFIVRYKGEKESLTGIKNEPWHLRYVGKEVAQVCQENDWCLEEFMNQFTG